MYGIALPMLFFSDHFGGGKTGRWSICCITREAPLSEHNIHLFNIFIGLMAYIWQSVWGEGPAVRLPLIRLIVPLSSVLLPLRLTIRWEKRTQSSSWWQNSSHTALFLPHAPIHGVNPLTRESEIFLDIKKDKTLIITTQVYRNTLQNSFIAAAVLFVAFGSRANAHLMAYNGFEQSVDSAE